jgi:hypothetical protein
MKYLVQLKYTNPAHEHVSLRRRVDTVNRIVEAATEEEAINRIARQQRALGYLIQEAKVIDSDAKKEKEQLDEAKKPDASLVMRDELKNKMITDKDKQTLGKVAALMASQKKKDVKEEVEQVDEGSKRMSAAVKLQRAFEREQTASDASRKRGEEMRTQARAEYAKKQAAKTNEEVEISEASKEGKDVMRNMRASLKSMDLRHGVDSDKRDSGYKMSPAVRAAQAKSDALSKVVKPVQAGTLAALKRRAMKTEAMDPNESKGEKKIVKTSKKAAKAAEKMVSAAKGKINKINIQPTMDIDVKNK